MASAGCTSQKCPPAATPTITKQVTSNSIQSVKITQTFPHINEDNVVGYQMRFQARAYDNKGKYIPNTKIKWSVHGDETTDGYITKEGMFVPSTPGTYIIYAEADGVRGETRVLAKEDVGQRHRGDDEKYNRHYQNRH